MKKLSPYIEAKGRYSGVWNFSSIKENRIFSSESSLEVLPILSNKFIRLEYSYHINYTSGEGSMYFNVIDASNKITLHWMDTLQLGMKVLKCKGLYVTQNDIQVQGNRIDQMNSDFFWRIYFSLSVKTFEIKMSSLSSDLHETFIVDAKFVKV